MSSQEQRQDRNNDRVTRGRGKPRGGYSSRGRERGGGHQKQPSMGYNTQYVPHNMYEEPGQGFYDMVSANFATYFQQGQQQQEFQPCVPMPQVPQESKAPLLKKAESNQVALDIRAKIAAKLAAQGDKLTEFKPKAAEPKVAEPKAAEPKVAEPKVAEPKVAEPKVAEPKAAEPPVQKQPEPRPATEPKPEPKPSRKPELDAEAQPASKARESKIEATEATNNDAANKLALMKARISQLMAQSTAQKEEPKVDAPKAEQPKVEEPKIEKPKAEEPRVEEPKVEEPKVESKDTIRNSEPKPEPEAEKEAKPEPEAEKEAKPEAEAIAPAAETKHQAQVEAKAIESKETESTGLADSVSKLKVDCEDQASPEPAATEEPEDESFSEQVKVASNIASPKDQKYPEGIAATSFDDFVYDITFLKQFQTVVPAINRRSLREIVNVEAQKGGRAMSNRGSRMGSQREGRNMSRHPSMASIHGKGRNSSRRKGDRQGSSRRDKDEPAVPVKPLVRGENAYVPRSLTVTESGKVEAATVDETPKYDLMPQEEVERRVKSLLNKMSLDNLDRIATKIIDIANQSKHEDDARTLQQIIGLTFDKACDEPHWSAMYAQFCIKLHDIDSDITANIGKDGSPVSGPHLFRRFMLSRCQKEFEQGWSSTQTEAAGDASNVMSDAYYAAVKAKRHGLGLVRFVGELFKNSFLQVKIISSCILRLSRETPTEEIVESMCKLITTIAPRLQLESPTILGEALEQLKTWRGTEGFPSRLRFMIMDVEDAHRTGWKVGDEGPKTLAEVHKEVADEQAAAESEKRGRGGGAFSGPSRRNERDSQRRLEKERNKLNMSSVRRAPPSDSSPTPTASSSSNNSSNPKKEPAKNMFNAFNELS